MKLMELLENCTVKGIYGDPDVDVAGLHYDSRQVSPGELFFALRGVVSDGHAFIASAIANGATAICCEERPLDNRGVTVIVVDSTRRAMAEMATTFFADPTREMTTVGITGTNGKTTITYLLEAIFAEADLAPAVIGTVNYRFGIDLRQAPHTTPEALDLMKQIRDFRRNGARSLIMEVSSHALDQHRADGVRFRVGVFTNLTPEHLDYHQTMERYFASKFHLFKELLPRTQGQAVVNIDDEYGRRLAKMLPSVLTCGRAPQAAVHPKQIEATLQGIHGWVATPMGEVAVCSSLLGDYNVENILCAIGAAVALEIPVATIAAGLAKASGVPGRLERIDNQRDAVILVDYAHTGDALQRVIDALQDLSPGRILTVFGCGGDRDRGKRPVMAEVAARGSDIAIATSDNPRSEDPQQILDDVRVGLSRVHRREWSCDEARSGRDRGYVVIEDRRQAIRFAVSLLRSGDVLLVAGKGHEDYQILSTGRIHFDDREELRQALQSGGEA